MVVLMTNDPNRSILTINLLLHTGETINPEINLVQVPCLQLNKILLHIEISYRFFQNYT